MAAPFFYAQLRCASVTWPLPLMALFSVGKSASTTRARRAGGNYVGGSTVPWERTSTSPLRRRRWVSGTLPTWTALILEY